jgi:hypothetical protein
VAVPFDENVFTTGLLVEVFNESAHTADKPTYRSDGFSIGNTVFHITVSLIERVCKSAKRR